MKVLLIHPFLTANNLNCPNQTEPLGLAYIAAYIRNDHAVEILDLYALGFNTVTKINSNYRIGLSDVDKIKKIIEQKNPDVIGIACNFTAFADDSFEVSKIIKDNFKNIPVVLGGAHASMDVENILKNNYSIDIVVRGEGEITFKALLDVLKDKGNLDTIDGISFRKPNNEIISNKKRELIKDIDALPFPARDLLDIEAYKTHNETTLPYAKSLPILTMLTSRGCPFECIFCSTKVVWGRLWRPRSVEKIVEEIEYLIKNYNIKEVAIYDDQFIVNKIRIHDLCDLIIKKGLEITISVPSGISGWLLDEELLKKMKKSGFYRFSLSIETGNENTLKFIKKRVNLREMLKVIEIANKLGFWLQSNFIIGFPFETREEIADTINYAINSGVDYAYFIIAQPYAGAEMYELYEKEGLLKKVNISGNTDTIKSANYDTKKLKAQEIQELRDKAHVLFLRKKLLSYAHPINFFKYLFPKLFFMKGGVRYAIKIFFTLLKLNGDILRKPIGAA